MLNPEPLKNELTKEKLEAHQKKLQKKTQVSQICPQVVPNGTSIRLTISAFDFTEQYASTTQNWIVDEIFNTSEKITDLLLYKNTAPDFDETDRCVDAFRVQQAFGAYYSNKAKTLSAEGSDNKKLFASDDHAEFDRFYKEFHKINDAHASDPDFKRLCDFLKTNKTIEKIHVSEYMGDFTDDHVKLLFEMLLVNRSIKILVLDCCKISSDNFKILEKIFRENPNLKVFQNDSKIMINEDSYIGLNNALADNVGLVEFSLGRAEIAFSNVFTETMSEEQSSKQENESEERCATAVANMLSKNKTLRKLNLSKGFEFRGWVIISRALKINQTLTHLHGFSNLCNYLHCMPLFRTEFIEITAAHPSLQAWSSIELKPEDLQAQELNEGLLLRDHRNNILKRTAAVQEMKILLPELKSLVTQYELENFTHKLIRQSGSAGFDYRQYDHLFPKKEVPPVTEGTPPDLPAFRFSVPKRKNPGPANVESGSSSDQVMAETGTATASSSASSSGSGSGASESALAMVIKPTTSTSMVDPVPASNAAPISRSNSSVKRLKPNG